MFEVMNTNMTNSTLDLKDTQSLKFKFKFETLSVSSVCLKDTQSLTASSIIVIFSQIVSLSIGLPLNCYVLFLLFTQGALKDMDVTFTVSQSTW